MQLQNKKRKVTLSKLDWNVKEKNQFRWKLFYVRISTEERRNRNSVCFLLNANNDMLSAMDEEHLKLNYYCRCKSVCHSICMSKFKPIPVLSNTFQYYWRIFHILKRKFEKVAKMCRGSKTVKTTLQNLSFSLFFEDRCSIWTNSGCLNFSPFAFCSFSLTICWLVSLNTENFNCLYNYND